MRVSWWPWPPHTKEVLRGVVMEKARGPFCLRPSWSYLLTVSNQGDLVCEGGDGRVHYPVPECSLVIYVTPAPLRHHPPRAGHLPGCNPSC